VNVPIICDNLRHFLAQDWQGMQHVVRVGNKPLKRSNPS
jgi:hypothetical protein